MDIAILGEGGLGRSVAAAGAERGDTVRTVGRPGSGRHDPATLAGADVIVEASRPDAVVGNLRAALDAGCRRAVIATTGWAADRPIVEALLVEHGAAAVVASNFSLGVALFGRLVDAAVGLFGPVRSFDPYLVEWHRRTKLDRPSGTAADLARRIVAAHPGKRRVADGGAGGRPDPDELEVVSIRAGASPGMHLVGFDSPGETVELRLTARDRSAYAAGILASADWLVREPRPAGLHPFVPIVDELLAGAPVA
ncbi:MAG TPA: dihydrodipicolinate reductase C-terminal domain-containing protein [Candidatus Sulfomarinibacteraceae bacterium]|nr:dihydrodipicolinate reductase C-terminal domain-containing protein [Candidatus Sulfomarinibacteraceae bacterium]